MNPMEKYFEELRKLGERVLEETCPFGRMASAQFFFMADAILPKGHAGPDLWSDGAV